MIRVAEQTIGQVRSGSGLVKFIDLIGALLLHVRKEPEQARAVGGPLTSHTNNQSSCGNRGTPTNTRPTE